MRTLVAAACIAVLAFVGYYFWGEYSRAKLALQKEENAARAVLANSEHLREQACDKWIAALNSWKNGKPNDLARSFPEAREQVGSCLTEGTGAGWRERNISVKYW